MKQGKYCYKCQKRNWKITKQRSAGRGRQAGLGIWILLEMDYDVRVPSLGILQALLSGSLAHSDCWIRDGRRQVLREQEQEQPPGGWGAAVKTTQECSLGPWHRGLRGQLCLTGQEPPPRQLRAHPGSTKQPGSATTPHQGVRTHHSGRTCCSPGPGTRPTRYLSGGR